MRVTSRNRKETAKIGFLCKSQTITLASTIAVFWKDACFICLHLLNKMKM